MARTYQPSTATRSNTATTPLDATGSGSFDGPDQRDENGRYGDNAERRENLTTVRNERDNSRDESRENRNERGNRNSRDDREFGENRGERTSRENAEQGSRHEHRLTPSAGLDAFAPVLEAWKQVFTSWSKLTETMVKAQQDAFAGMLGSAGTTAKKINVGERDRR